MKESRGEDPVLLLGMVNSIWDGDDIEDEVSIPLNPKIESPVAVDTGLPDIVGLIVLLGL
jgi:hypothetical protein